MPTQVSALVFDCVDAARVAAFWAAVMGREVDEGADAKFAGIGFANLDPDDHQLHFLFQQVPEGKTAKNRMHADFLVEDLDAEVDRILQLGATRIIELDDADYRWVTLADPEGNEFDIVARAKA